MVLLFIQPFEYTFFYLEDLTLRAAPRLGKFFKGSTGRNPCFGISFFGIIEIVAFETDPSMAFTER
jgi:hypothetical protein